jgi:AcrR family transcriptional regulator
MLRRLLDAGAAVFAEHGYHAARVDDIVKVADTSHGTFYLYFANKEELFQALTFDAADELRSLTEQLDPIGPTAAGRRELRRWLGEFVAVGERYGPVMRAWAETSLETTDGDRVDAGLLADLARTLRDRIPVDRIAGLDADVAALALVAMVERSSYYVITDQVGGDRDELLDLLTDVAFAGLFGAGKLR